jgi:N-acetylmuramoyl-L-alanine amidase
LQNGRPEYWIGAHAKGVNDISLGVCLIGRKKFTDYQFDTLEKLLKKWKLKYVNATIEGHCESTITQKTCPNFDVQKWCIKRGLC